ncbi:MAG: NAD(P)-binding domain-containing protein [Saprospiraceae bacterium]|nr:NAD(P)-binding domain-containing protein [Saprospiraceae bacterium]
MKKIGIIGSGIVAQTLGAGFLKHGHEVMLGTRDVAKLSEWKASKGSGAEVGSFAETASFGDIIVLAAKGTAAKAALELAGAENLDGKTVIDATNPIADLPPENGVLQFFTSLEASLMEQLQTHFPKANFVKAFNSVGSAAMVNPSFESKPTMFICGNSEEAKKEVSQIIDVFGWEAADFGTVEAARAIEPLCMLWCIPGFTKGEWTHAFKLLKS